MADLQENTTYQSAPKPGELAAAASAGASQVAKSYKQFKAKRPTPQQVTPNLAAAMANPQQSPAPQPARTTPPPQVADRTASSYMPEPWKGLGTMTTPYGGSTEYEPGGKHYAIDIASPIGTPIPSNVSGTVTEVVEGKKQFVGNNPQDKGYGNYVIVTDRYGNKHRYSHLNKSWVKVGQKVQPGAQLGEMGNTGSSYSLHGGTGSHLDYRIADAYNKYMSPLTYAKQYGWQ